MSAESEFDQFFAAGFRRLTLQVFAMTGNLPEAEDAVQDAFARAWQRWAQVSCYGDPEGWVRTVAFRIAVSSWRAAGNRLRAHRRAGERPAVPELSPDRLALLAALAQINRDQRRVIVLHYLAGLSVQEIAAELGTSPNTVKTRLLRGRRALLAHVDEFADDALGDAHSARHAGKDATFDA